MGGVACEQRIEAQHGREQCGDPDDAGRDAPQQFRLRPDAERKQDNGEHEKSENEADIAALPRRKPQIMANQAKEGVHQTINGSPGGAANASIARVVALGRRIGWWVATTTLPPAARCAEIAISSWPSPSMSSAAPGS